MAPGRRLNAGPAQAKEHVPGEQHKKVPIMTRCCIQKCVLALVILALLLCAVPSALAIEAALGETIPLSGYSPSSQWVYLYLTGPNLPVNGVMLNDVTQRADEGHFTKVAVDGNDYWSYKWGTGNVGGRLDAGTYTIWVVNGPNDRSNLAQAEYRTLSVTLGTPSIAVDSVQQNGALELASVPTGASVSLNGQYRGTTPVTVSDLPPGTYQITFTRGGYYEFNTPVAVEAGRISEVTATLELIPEPTMEQAPPAEMQTPATPETTAPLPTPKAAAIIPALPLAASLVLWGVRRWR
jgi:hypothetical protein